LADSIVPRQQWAAIEPRRQIKMNGRADEIFLWQTGPDTCSLMGLTADKCQGCLQDSSCTEQIVKALQDADFKEGNDDIKYNFLIDQDGVIYEGRGWGVVGQHTKGRDSHSIGVAVIGDFGKKEPSQALQDALSKLIICGQAAEELSSGARLRTTPAMSGQAFYDMLDRCDGLCLDD
uniref:PGRP-Hd - Peptidoglycan recognition protein homologue n=1 Tax=Alvinella pompejana TaxID=6376 RepID=D0VX04_9ANNE|nr:Chain A, PGRP-Hd - Peptidoglycan recognition protein homologue [Alvinella pompejana]3EP1_B Chain B, PGRP-Hd - Peptidoglycan recognition protein homologue [Alvinella pompejana]